MLLLLAAEHNLGRVDISTFSDQTLMEMLIADIPADQKQRLQDHDGVYTDACSWGGVSCDEDRRIVKIRMQCRSNTSISLNLSFLPPNLTSFISAKRNYSGELDTGKLPQGLEQFALEDNQFHGTVDFASWPPNIISFTLEGNAFTGSVHLSKLSISLRSVNIKENKFTGGLDLSNLPTQLEYLDVSKNMFSGDFCLQNVSENLYVVSAGGNNFNARAIASRNCLVRLPRSGVQNVVDEEGKAYGENELRRTLQD